MKMNHQGFEILLTQRKDEGWVSWTPQQPGLSSWGFNKAEALKGIEKSINEYITMKKGNEFKNVKSE